ncbi:MAG: ABC transporter ATP-binding protein [Nitrospirae bacterium]|nr:ABC transporter ATP-binding protein [Nitrospirota bacterium]
MTCIETKSVGKRYGDVQALEGVDLDIRPGEWVSIMGPSGSGKTTLLNLIACLDVPTTGALLFDGQDISRLNGDALIRWRREKIGLVFQQFHLVPYLSALENVMLAQYFHSMVDEREASESLESVGMGGRLAHKPSQLSGGEQQRVCIARALINHPAIVLADEPTGNLDVDNERIVLDLLRRFHAEGKTIVVVTHNPEIGELGDRVVTLKHGRLAPAI